MNRFLMSVATLLAMLIALSACAPSREWPDAAGAKKSEALSLAIERQFELAGLRYRDLNLRFAALQREIHEGPWRDVGTISEVAPWPEPVMGSSSLGTIREDGYHFAVFRELLTPGDPGSVLENVKTLWESRGWVVSHEDLGSWARITTYTPDGYWFALTDQVKTMAFTAHSPGYWGAQDELLSAVGDRRRAEDAAGETWDTTDRDEEGYAIRVPGEYRPFPDWDTPIEPGSGAESAVG